MRYLPFLFLLAIVSLGSCAQPEAEEALSGSIAEESLLETSIPELGKQYRDGSLTVLQAVQYYLARIEAIDQNGPGLRAVLAVNPEAEDIARALDAELKSGKDRGPLHGVPVLLKDNIDTGDKQPTTAGSRALLGNFAAEDAPIVARLREAGAIILGKTNLSEWANFRSTHSSSGWSGAGGQTHNPYHLSCNPCGSSSGSGVAVSANLCAFAIGTETNGSIVCPSSANGIVGIKPTVGLLSRTGIIPISFTQDTPGPMARTVTDAAIALGAMVGEDPKDPKTEGSSAFAKKDYTPFLDSTALKGKRLGYYTAVKGQHYKVDAVMGQAIAQLKEQGAEVVEINARVPSKAGGLSYQIMLYEFKDGLNAYLGKLGEDAPVQDIDALIAFNKADGVELQHFHQDILEQAAAMGGLESEGYTTALEEMLRLSREEGIDKIMEEHQLDALIAPTGGPAWKTDHANGDHYTLGSSSPAARAGYPNITVPMGMVDGLPVGISFFGRAWSEPLLIGLAYDFEQAAQARAVPTFEP